MLSNSTANPTNHHTTGSDCAVIPYDDCPDKIYSNTESTLADVICWFRVGWFPLSFDPDSKIILGQFPLAGHEIFTSYQMNNRSSITHFYSNCVPLLCITLSLLSQQDKKWNATIIIHCWHMSYITNNAVQGQMGSFFNMKWWHTLAWKHVLLTCLKWNFTVHVSFHHLKQLKIYWVVWILSTSLTDFKSCESGLIYMDTPDGKHRKYQPSSSKPPLLAAFLAPSILSFSLRQPPSHLSVTTASSTFFLPSFLHSSVLPHSGIHSGVFDLEKALTETHAREANCGFIWHRESQQTWGDVTPLCFSWDSGELNV